LIVQIEIEKRQRQNTHSVTPEKGGGVEGHAGKSIPPRSRRREARHGKPTIAAM